MAKIFIAGKNGMVGTSIWTRLQSMHELIGASSKELDLRDQKAVGEFVYNNKPDVIIDAAARVGGILANNQYPYTFLMDNLQIQNNLITEALHVGVKKFIFMGSSCIYPKLAPQPLKEEYLLSGPLEPTNEWYALAKIAGIKACEAIRKQYNLDYVSLMPTNLYGPNDNFDLKTSHVLPAMMRKFHKAKLGGNTPVTLWGSGLPMREFLHVDDVASAVEYALDNVLPEHLYNVGYGSDITIKGLAMLIQKVTGHEGEIIWDETKPDGTPKKLMDSSKLRALGWKPSIKLESGIRSTYEWFLANQDHLRERKITAER